MIEESRLNLEPAFDTSADEEIWTVLDLETVIARFETKVFNTALALTGSVTKSEEILFEVFASISTQLEDEPSGTKLFEKAINLAMDLAIQACIEDDEPDYGEDRFQRPGESVSEHLMRAIINLDLCGRMVFVLRDIQGLKLAQVAEILGTNVFSVGRYLRQARIKVGEELKGLSQVNLQL